MKVKHILIFVAILLFVLYLWLTIFDMALYEFIDGLGTLFFWIAILIGIILLFPFYLALEFLEIKLLVNFFKFLKRKIWKESNKEKK